MSRMLEVEGSYQLLLIIDKNEDVDNLAKEFGYVNVAIEIRNMITDGFVFNDGVSFKLTEKGKAQLDHLEKVVLMKHKGWIFPKNDEKIPPIGENVIYLPSNLEILN